MDHEKGYLNDGGNLDPESRTEGWKDLGLGESALTFNFTPSPFQLDGSGLHLHRRKGRSDSHSLDLRMARLQWSLGFVQYCEGMTLLIIKIGSNRWG